MLIRTPTVPTAAPPKANGCCCECMSQAETVDGAPSGSNANPSNLSFHNRWGGFFITRRPASFSTLKYQAAPHPPAP